MIRRACARVLRGLAALPPAVVLGAAWGLVLLYAYPGLLTLDSFDHLREARSGVYTDSHPPIINLAWKLVEYVITGPFGMLVIQTGLLLAGLYAIFRRTFDPRRAAWWTAAVFVVPPVSTTMTVIWKDCWMAGLLAVGIAGVLSTRRWARLAGVIALTIAQAFRYNALGATLPLIVLLFEWRPGMHWLRRYALSTATWLAATCAAMGINAALTDKPMHYWVSSLAAHDLVGTLAYSDGTLSDAELRAELAGTGLLVDHDIHARIRQLYTPRDFYALVHHPTLRLWDLPIMYDQPAPEPQRAAVVRAWWHAISTRPWAYVKHRLAVTAEVLDLRSTRSMGTPLGRRTPYVELATQLGVVTQASQLQIRMTRWARAVSAHTPLYVPWIYALVSIVLLWPARRDRDVLALLLSGLVMESSLLLLAHGCDYRYSHWMVMMTIVSTIVLATRRYRAAIEAGAIRAG